MEDLEQYHYLMSLSDEYSELLDKENQRHEQDVKNIKSDNRIKLKKAILTLLLVPIVIGLLLGEFVFVSELKGANTICYTTMYRDCFHASYCDSLSASSHKTTVYDAKRDGYRECSECTVGQLDISYNHHYLWSVIGSVSIFCLPVLCVFENKKMSLIKGANSIHETNTKTLFLTYSPQ